LENRWVKTVYYYGFGGIEEYRDYFPAYPADLPKNDTNGEYCLDHFCIAQWDSQGGETTTPPSDIARSRSFGVLTLLFGAPLVLYGVLFVAKALKRIRQAKPAKKSFDYSVEFEKIDVTNPSKDAKTRQAAIRCSRCNQEIMQDNPEKCPHCGCIIQAQSVSEKPEWKTTFRNAKRLIFMALTRPASLW
jgi:hypothetical protein